MDKPSLTLRIDLSREHAVGPGKLRLLEEIDRCSSLSQAGRNLGISYRRAWLMIDDVNRFFAHAVIEGDWQAHRDCGAQLSCPALGQTSKTRLRLPIPILASGPLYAHRRLRA
jgi:molybdate transport system regulatory protein